jgi:hypothetical protein
VSGAPVSGAPVSGAPVSGAPVSGAPVSGAPVSGATGTGAIGTGPSTKEFPVAKPGAAGKAGASAAGAGGPGGRGGLVGGGLAGAWQRTSPPQRKLVVGAAVLMVAAAIAIAVVSFGPGGTSGGGSQNSASAGTQTAGSGAPAGQPSPAPAPSGSHHKARHHKPARHHHPAKTPEASPSPSPTPKKPRHHPRPGPHGVARLTASVSVSGPTSSSRDARVTYAASSIGSIATKSLSSAITLPAGAVLAHDWEQNGSSGGWDCHSGGHEVICRHSAVPKDNQAVGSFSIVVRSRTACGQPVTFSVDGGTPRTQAQSSALIQCSNVRFGALGLTAQSTMASGLQLTARLARPLAV